MCVLIRHVIVIGACYNSCDFNQSNRLNCKIVQDQLGLIFSSSLRLIEAAIRRFRLGSRDRSRGISGASCKLGC